MDGFWFLTGMGLFWFLFFTGIALAVRIADKK